MNFMYDFILNIVLLKGIEVFSMQNATFKYAEVQMENCHPKHPTHLDYLSKRGSVLHALLNIVKQCPSKKSSCSIKLYVV